MSGEKLDIGLAQRFERESHAARQLIVNRPEHWRYLLAIELLRSKLGPVNKQFQDLQQGRAFKRSRQLNEKEAISWLITKVEDLKNLIPYLSGIICNGLMTALKNDDPNAILDAVAAICEGGRQLLAWEEDIRFSLLPSRIEPIRKTLHGTTVQFFDVLNELADQIDAPFKKKNPAGKYEIKVVFKDPPNMAKLSKQLTALVRDVEMNPMNWLG